MLDHFDDDLLWYLDDFILRKQPRINVWHCSIYSIRQMLPVQQLVRARAALLVPQTPSLISPDTARACLPATHVTRAAGRSHVFQLRSGERPYLVASLRTFQQRTAHLHDDSVDRDLDDFGHLFRDDLLDFNHRWHFFRDDLRRMRTFGQAPKVAPPAVTK